LDELAETGYAGLTFEGVARRAGVHKTTVYRRWSTLERLVLAAMLEQARLGVPVADTGSLRTDLLALGLGSAATTATAQSETVLRTVVGVGSRDAAIARASREFWDARLAMDAAIVERAIGRDEVDAGTCPREVIEAVLAPIYFRRLVTSEPVDDDYVKRLVDRVCDGVTGAGRRTPRARR
jgi:AcrR family transcriptional regulator